MGASQQILAGYGAAPFVGPLDSYTTSLTYAWSVARRLLTSYTGSLVRVRRSSDNAEQDIGYTASGSLDTASLLSFCGGGNGFVTTIYAQQGSTAWTQSTAASQPKIVNSGSVLTLAGQPMASCATAQLMQASLVQAQNLTVMAVWAEINLSGYATLLGQTGNSNALGIDSAGKLYCWGSSGFQNTITRTASGCFDAWLAKGASSKTYRAGAQVGSTGTTNFTITATSFLAGTNGSPSVCNFNEMLIYGTDASANIPAIYAVAQSFYTGL